LPTGKKSGNPKNCLGKPKNFPRKASVGCNAQEIELPAKKKEKGKGKKLLSHGAGSLQAFAALLSWALVLMTLCVLCIIDT